MNANADDPEKEDVYSIKTYIGADSKNVLEHFSIRVTAGNSALSLSRIFGLLATLTIVPAASQSKIVSVDELAIMLDFRDVSYSSIDRLCRKLSQITEIVAVSILPMDYA